MVWYGIIASIYLHVIASMRYFFLDYPDHFKLTSSQEIKITGVEVYTDPYKEYDEGQAAKKVCITPVKCRKRIFLCIFLIKSLAFLNAQASELKVKEDAKVAAAEAAASVVKAPTVWYCLVVTLSKGA